MLNAVMDALSEAVQMLNYMDVCRHDDRSMYTGVYAQGGPTNVDKKVTFQDIVNRDAPLKGINATWTQ